MSQLVVCHSSSRASSQRASSAQPTFTAREQDIFDQSAQQVPFASISECGSAPASRVESKPYTADVPSHTSHRTRRSRRSSHAPSAAPSQPAQYAPFVPPQTHDDHAGSKAESRGPAAGTASQGSYRTSSHKRTSAAPSQPPQRAASVPAPVYASDAGPRATSRASADKTPSQASHRTRRSHRSGRAPSATPSRQAQPTPRRDHSQVPTVVEDEEACSEVDMFADLRKLPRPKVCHHLEADNVSHCDSEAFPCEVMEDGVTLNKGHVHSKDVCGYDA